MNTEPNVAPKAARAAAPKVVLEGEPLPAETAATEELPPGYVRTRIMKRGHNKISTGLVLPLEEVVFPNYKQGDIVAMPRDTAIHYEDDLGWVEILP